MRQLVQKIAVYVRNRSRIDFGSYQNWKKVEKVEMPNDKYLVTFEGVITVRNEETQTWLRGHDLNLARRYRSQTDDVRDPDNN